MEDQTLQHPTPPVSKPTTAELAKALTHLQRKFGNEYVKDFNGTQAAIRADYKERSAASIAWENLRKPEIRAYIDALLEEQSLSPKEVIKSISDIARADIKDCFVITKVIRRQKVSISLAEYMERLEEDIDTADHIHRIEVSEGLLGEGEDLEKNIEEHKRAQFRRKRALIPHRVRLAKEPDARMFVDGPDELVEVADLDLAKLVQDKSAGRIKSFANTEYGPKIELYAADAALALVGKHHKLFTEKHEHTGADGTALPPAQTTIHVVSIGVPFAGSEDAVKV
jgi:phage terminase small subunit